MKKQEFLDALKKRLSSLPQNELEEQLSFYSEMIDDRVEDGISEEEAIKNIGSLDGIASGIIKEPPQKKHKTEEKKDTKNLFIMLLAFGFPIWFPLLVSAFAVVFSLYVSMWSIVISLWATFISFAVSAPAGAVVGVIYIFIGNGASGAAVIGASLALAGLALFSFYGCIWTTRLLLFVTKKIWPCTKSLFSKLGGLK